jgi:RND superfamily putative drug exporter
MSDQADTNTSSGRPSAPFRRLGEFVVRRPLAVIALWLGLTAVLALTLPSLQQMLRERPVDLLPRNAPVVEATRQMVESFHESGSQNILLVVLTREGGLGPADEDVYRALVDNLHREHQAVATLQDFVGTPAVREVVASQDNKAWYIPVGLTGEIGTQRGYEAYKRVAEIAKQTTAGTALTVNLTGPAATVADLTDVGERDLHVIEIATAVMVLTILLVVYRNPVTMALPLVTIGLSLVLAQDVIAGLAKLGLGLSNQTVTFMTAMMVGAGVDYAVFLISRYHEYLRLGFTSDDAVLRALTSIGKVIAASAATVAVTFLGMSFTRLGLFSAIGPALAISIVVAFVAAITLLPAILVLSGRRGWVAPRRDLTTRFWRRSGIRIVRRPKSHLVASLLVLAVLAGCAGLLHANYDDRKTLPAAVESNRGYAAMDRHYPLNSTIPQYIYVRSEHDLRTPKALADLEQMAQRVSQRPDVAAVRGITRPTGESLEQARLSHQAGEVGDKLKDASGLIEDRTGDLDQLAGGADAIAQNLGGIRGGVDQAISSVHALVEALTFIENQFGGTKTLDQIDAAAKLSENMRALGDSLGVNLELVNDSFGWVTPVLIALNASPICSADPSCGNSRAQLQRLADARDNGALDNIAGLVRQLQSTRGDQTLSSTVQKLRGALDTATKSVQQRNLDDLTGLQVQLSRLQQGADDLADASRRLADGVQLLVDQTKQMGTGLSDASAFLLAMRHDAAPQTMSGFYIPPQIMTQNEFKDAAAVFISADGHAARYLVQTKLNPFSTEAMDQVESITGTARSAQPNTALADASISVVGFPATLRDIRHYYQADIRLIVAVTILVVLAILTVLLRAVVAPLYLVGSVIVSYLSALGIGVIVFQIIGGQELSWSVAGMAFIVLVAVGADYNLLLISRIRDESPNGIRSGVIRTVGSTGGVITSAGVIFAASMFGLVFGGIGTMVQAGFIIGMGLLLDTFLVRTVTVPALAVLIGKANWWPSDRVSNLLARWRTPKEHATPTERHAAPTEQHAAPLQRQLVKQ